MSLKALFSPESIAIIGASTRPGAVGNDVVKNILAYGYAGKVYPVNPKADTLLGLACYPDLKSIGASVDLAIIVIPAAGVPAVLAEAAALGIRQAIIISAGFRETGAAGTALEEAVIKTAQENSISLLGPNCLGYLHPGIGLNASFAKQMPQPGNISFFSQSGALSTALLDMTADSLGFSHFASIGNKAILSEADFLEYFAEEPATEVIGFYSEGLSDAPLIVKRGRSILKQTHAKPVIALKSGATEAGTRASSSHTGSLAGSDAAYSALFRQARIIRSDSFSDLLDALLLFSKNPLPSGTRVAVITNAGGLGVLASDALIRAGLSVPTLSQTTQDALRPLVPPAASVTNPIDVLGDADASRYQDALRVVGQDPHVDMLLFIVTPQSMTEGKQTAEALVEFKKSTQLPIAAVFAGEDSFQEASLVLKAGGIALYRFAEAGAKALGALSQVALWRRESKETPFVFSDIDKQKVRAVIAHAEEEKRAQLRPDEAQAILSAYGFPFPQSATVTTKAEAKKVAAHFKKPFVLKIVSPDIIHKSDAGGVILGVTEETLESSYDTLMANVRAKAPEAAIVGVYMGEMAPTGGKELILGIKEEPGLGKLIMLGLGGIYVEVFRDASFRFAPLTKEDAQEMLGELKSVALLKGARGEESADLEAITDAVGRLSALVTDFPEIQELDINPLLVFPDAGSNLALDARITLSA